MRHRVAYRKLGRVTEHRIAMLRNQAVALLRNDHVKTTVARAKELRPFVERIISIAKRSLDAPEGSAQGVIARRRVAADINDREVVTRLFDTIAPKYVERPGGYTRLLRMGYRRGDSAEVATVELVGFEFDPSAVREGAAAEGEKPKKKTMGERMRSAFTRKKTETPESGAQQKTKSKATRPAKGAAKKVTTPRKAGGS